MYLQKKIDEIFPKMKSTCSIYDFKKNLFNAIHVFEIPVDNMFYLDDGKKVIKCNSCTRNFSKYFMR